MGLNVINQAPPEGYKDCNDFLLKGSALLKINSAREKAVERG